MLEPFLSMHTQSAKDFSAIFALEWDLFHYYSMTSSCGTVMHVFRWTRASQMEALELRLAAIVFFRTIVIRFR